MKISALTHSRVSHTHDRQAHPVEAAENRPAPLKMVAVGDSLVTGFQDASLHHRSQQLSFGKLLADQAGLEFKQPLISDNGIPPSMFIDTDASIGGTLWKYAVVGAAMAGPLSLLALGLTPPELLLTPLYHAGGMGEVIPEGPTQNLAVPNVELRHLTSIDNVNDMTREMADGAASKGSIFMMAPFIRNILQEGKSSEAGKNQIQRAIEQDPDLVLFWGGNNDALEPATKMTVDDRTLTPLEDKVWEYTVRNPLTGSVKKKTTPHVMPGFRSSLVGENGALTRLLNETDAEIMLMNIPDVTVIPFLRTVGEKVGPLPFRIMLPTGIDLTAMIEDWTIPDTIDGLGKAGRTKFPEGTQVSLGKVLRSALHIFTAPEINTEQAVFDEDQVLDPEEIDQVKERTAAFNRLLADTAAAEERVHLVDVASLLTQTSQGGTELRGEGQAMKITNGFIGTSGQANVDGLFGYDGIHPSDVGHAAIANRILDTIKSELSDDPRFTQLATAPSLDEKQYFQNDYRRQGDQRPILLLGWAEDAMDGDADEPIEMDLLNQGLLAHGYPEKHTLAA